MTAYSFTSQNLKSFQEAELQVLTEKKIRKIANNINFIAIGATTLGIALTSEPSMLNQPDLTIWMAGYMATVVGPVVLATLLVRNALGWKNISHNEKVMQASYDVMKPEEKDYIQSQLQTIKNSLEDNKKSKMLSVRENFLDKQKGSTNKPGRK
jgi:hypothetical protein